MHHVLMILNNNFDVLSNEGTASGYWEMEQLLSTAILFGRN
jgi:hypothetical protein